MGQTLTHGIYLPDEGERNCYSGLAANWQLLDTSVGTIAAHTAALAGKAPLVHTHGNLTNDGKVGTDANKPLITGTGGVVQAGSFGTAANTFCEGNDSRLSDARTPVSHTHTKSDVTDLLNSDFIPSANNSYNLGSSSYQWNNLYAKNYYYNGTAWGLDKNNKWLTTNLFYGSLPIFLRGSDNDIYNVSPQSLVQSLISFVDKNNTTMSSIAFQHRTDAPETHRLCIRQQKVTSDGYYGVNLNNLGNFYPEQNNAINLGTSTNRWKSLNGVNPGALSLPDMGTTADVNYFDFTSTITPLDGTDIFYRPPVDGWMTVVIAGTALALFEDASSSSKPHVQGSAATAAPVKGYCEATIPVHKNVRVKINAIGTSVYMAQVRPCMGNV